MKFDELKRLWIENLNKETKDVACWIFTSYLPKLYLYDDGSILFCSHEPSSLCNNHLIVIDLQPLQDELTDWFYFDTKDLSEAEKDYIYQEFFVDNPQTDDLVMDKIVEFVKNIDDNEDEYPIYTVWDEGGDER